MSAAGAFVHIANSTSTIPASLHLPIHKYKLPVTEDSADTWMRAFLPAAQGIATTSPAQTISAFDPPAGLESTSWMMVAADFVDPWELFHDSVQVLDIGNDFAAGALDFGSGW